MHACLFLNLLLDEVIVHRGAGQQAGADLLWGMGRSNAEILKLMDEAVIHALLMMCRRFALALAPT